MGWQLQFQEQESRKERLSSISATVQAKGLAHTKGEFLGAGAEEADADELRLAVADVLCRGPERLKKFKEVLPSIEAFEGGLRRLESPYYSL